MGLGDEIGNLLQQYSGRAAPTEQTEQDFDAVARHAPAEDVQHGLSEAFRSDQTPPFPQMVGHLFNQGDSQQRAGMLNQLLGGMGPSVLGSLMGGGMAGGLGGRQGGLGGLGGGLGNILGGLLNRNDGQAPSITPEQADRLSPDQVSEIAEHAERENPGIVDRMSGFYAEHPTLVKTLGGMALSIALGKIADRNR
jgi:hypothetical protein